MGNIIQHEEHNSEIETEQRDDEDGDESQLKLRDQILLKMSHQMDEIQKLMMQFFKYQTQNSENLNRKIGEFVDHAKLLISSGTASSTQTLLNQSTMKDTIRSNKRSNLSPSLSNSSNKTNNNANESSDDSIDSQNEESNSSSNLLTSTFAACSNSSMTFNNESNVEQMGDLIDLESNQTESTSRFENNKSNSEDDYLKFKKKYEILLNNRIGSNYLKLDFHEMRSNSEAKKARVPQALNEINVNIYILLIL